MAQRLRPPDLTVALRPQRAQSDLALVGIRPDDQFLGLITQHYHNRGAPER